MCEPGWNVWAAEGEEKSRWKVWGVLRRAEGARDGWQEELALGFLPSLGGNKTRREKWEREKGRNKEKGGKGVRRSMQHFPFPPAHPEEKGIFFFSLPSHPPRPKPFQLELPFVVQRALPLILHLALVCVVAAGGRDGGSRRVFVANGVVGLGVCFSSPGESGFGLGLKCGGEKGPFAGVRVRVCVCVCVCARVCAQPGLALACVCWQEAPRTRGACKHSDTRFFPIKIHFHFFFFFENLPKEVSEGQSLVADLEVFTNLSLCLAMEAAGIGSGPAVSTTL